MPTNIQANLILNDSQPRQVISRLAKDVGSLNFAQPLGRISGDAAEFTKSLSAATARVTAFGLTAGAIYKVSQAIREGAKATIEVDKQLVELNTYLGKSRNELEGFSQSLFKVAKNSAVPFEAAAEAAKEFARQGLSANEILKRTGSALTLARIAGISYAQAVNGITTAINSFNKEALTSEDITNKLIAVDTRFAVSSAQLNEALSRVGSSAEESGLSIDKLIATVTAAQQITGRGGAVIGNALKTIFTRLQRPEVLSQLEMLGVAVKDQNGYLLDGISILKNYSDATKNLSQTEKSRTAELVGGIYQINQVNALIKDLSSSNSIYADALRVSSAATDEAKKKNEELNKSMAALLQQTKTSAQEAAAALGSSLLDPLVKLGSAVSEGLLKLVSPNSDLFGQGEDSGKKFADGLRKGAASILGKTLGAGGLPLLVATGGLLAAKYAKFGVSSLKQLGKSSSGAFPSEKELQIQKRINDTLRENPAIIDSVISRKMNLAQAEAEVLRLIQEQNRSLLTQSRITGRVTSTVSTAQKASRKGIGRLFAEGYIPDTGVEAAAFQLEENTARRMGAVNPKAEVVQATIQGKTGPVIVNDKEKIIPNYGGTGETAIIPNYRNLDEIPRMFKGYIPNFAWSKSNKMPKDFLIKYPQSKAAIKAGRMYSPEVRAMLQKLQTGEKIDRDLLDALIERDIPIREVIAPSSVKDLPSQALIKNALDKEQAKRANKLSELPAGSEITVRQDVPSMTRKGVGVVKTESSGGFKSYDSFVAFDNPVMGKSAGLERASLNIGAGKEKSPLLKISGTLSKDQSLPKDLKNWTQVGYNPDRHSYYYDRKTKKPIVGGQQAIQIGNTVFVKEAIPGNREDFSYAKGYIPNFAKSKFIQNIIDSYKASLIEKDPIRFNAAQKNENYYPNVNSELKNLSVSSGASLEKLAYGLAALSGNTADSAARKGIQRIANNQPYDDLVLLPENVEKVKKMLASSGSTEELMSILGKGAKTQNFAQSLLLSKNFSGFGKYKNPLNTPSVMDSWAIYVRNGGALKEKYDRGAVSEKQKSKVFSQSAGGYKYYNKLVKEYGAAAKELGVPVRELQARTWAWARTQVGSRTRNDSFASGRIPNFAINPEKFILGGRGANLLLTSPYDSLKTNLDPSSQVSGGIGYGLKFPDRSYASTARSAGVDVMQALHDSAKKQGGRAYYAPHVPAGAISKYGADVGGMNMRNIFFLQQLVSKNQKDFPPSFVSSVLSINPANASLKGTGSLYNDAREHLTRRGFSSIAIGKKFREGASGLHDEMVEKYAGKNKYSISGIVSRVSDVGGSVIAPSSGHALYSKSAYADAQFSSAQGIDITHEIEKLTGVKVAGTTKQKYSPSGKPMNRPDPAGTSYQPISSFLPYGVRFDKGDPISRMFGIAGGYIPNFSGLSKAVSREKTMSGLPASQIMAHFDGGGNPLAVTNKRDEPNGLKDVPNFALPSRQLVTVLSRLGLLKGRNNLANPISAGVELFAGSAASSTLDTLAENELIDPRASTFANVAIPGAIGLKNIGKGIFGKGSKTQRGIAVASGVGQLTAGTLAGFQGGADLGNRINTKKFEQALDRSKKTFQDLTENTLELSNSLAKLDDAYRDPKADPKQILKLSASIADLLSKVKGSNPGLVSKLASETTLAGKQAILEDNAKESQRIQSVRQEALKFSSKGTILGKDAPKELDSFFRSVINSGNQDLLKQDLSKAGPANFSEVLSKGGLNVEEFSNVFKTDELKKGFLDALKLTQKLNEISSNQEAAIIDVSKPLTRKKQQTEDRREIRSSISKALEDQLPELASFAGGFSKRAGISAASDASLAIKTTQSSVSFQNSLLAQLSDKEFTKGLPSQVQAKLNAIETPGVATGRDLESIKQLPGLSKAQVAGIEKLIQFNSLQTREIQKAGTIANETKNIQLKFLALQEKLAFGGDIKTSINPQMRAESMSAGLRGPLTYQLGTLFGSRRTQVGGATDFLTETMQKYPGLLQTKNGKEPADISGVKRELTGLNAMDMQRDLLKRANMAQMMGLGQTSGLLRNKAFDSKYLFESAGLKADALFGSPEVPGEVKSSMQDYEKFGVQSAKQAKADDSELKRVEDLLVPIKQQITEQATALGQGLVSGFEASLKSTFGDKGIQADVVKLVTSQVNGNASKSGAAQASDGPPVMNFANPVNDAITREKMALAKRGIMGVPNFAMASINLERSPNLVTASNPQGFGVTNSIDEKNGLRSLGMRSSGFVPNYAAFGDKISAKAKKQAELGKLYVWDHIDFGFRKVMPSGNVDPGLIDKKDLPKGSKTISTELDQLSKNSIIPFKDPKITKLDELKLPGLARSRPIDAVMATLNKDGKLTPKNLLNEINKISKGKDAVIKTAFGKSNLKGLGVYGLGGQLSTSDTKSIIGKYKRGTGSGFFVQEKVPAYYDELRVHVAVDDKGRVKIIKGGTILKATGLDPSAGDSIKAYMDAGMTKKEATRMTKSFRKAAEVSAFKAVREAVKIKGIKNSFFGVDVGATSLEAAIEAGVKSKEFDSGGRGRVGTVVFELNPSDKGGSSGNVGRGILGKLIKNIFGTKSATPGLFGENAARAIDVTGNTITPGQGLPALTPRFRNGIGSNSSALPSGFAPKGSAASASAARTSFGSMAFGSNGGLPPSSGGAGGGVPPPSRGYFGSMAFGSNGGNPPGGSSASTTGSSTILNKLKGAGKYGGKALGGLAGAASIYEYYEGFQEAKKDKYAGAAKMFEATGGLAIAGAGLAGAGLATTLALPLAVGALGYGAIKGVEATGLLDATYGAGYGTVGLGAIGSKSIRGMTSRTAFNDDMIVARKQELLKGINRYNSVAGNPLVSTEFQVSRSTAAQKRKDEQDLEQLNNRLDEESQATRAGITSRATAAGAAETARLNQESAAQEEARSSKLRKSFLESFDKNAEANGYTTTKDKANYLLGQEGKNGIGSFKYTDFKDQEFAKSFDIYKTAKEAETAREANRVIPKSAIEFRDRPMPSFPQDVLEEATRTGRSAERVIQDRAESNVRGGASSQGMTTPEINAQMSRDYTADTGLPSFPKDVLEEAVRRRVTAEQVMKERAGGGVPNFAAMSNGMMSSGDVYSRMRSSAPRNFAPSYAQGSVPNFAAGDFTNAVTEALKTGITSAFPGGGGSSSTVSNSNVINIDGRSSIQNAPDEAMQGIISILFDKIPELKKLGPAALNFKK